MKGTIFFICIILPIAAFSQTKVQPDGYKLLIGLLILLAIPVIVFLFSKMRKKKASPQKQPPGFFKRKKLKIELTKDRKYRPKNLTLHIRNIGKKDVDIEAPLLVFRKIWNVRKFKLKGINKQEIYPLYLERNKVHEVQVDLTVFYNHDRKLKKYYRAKVILKDTKGKKYSSKNITLRKSLVS